MGKKGGVLRRIVVNKIDSLSKMADSSYPQSVTFSFKHLPEAKDWKNGEKYHLVLEVEQKSSTKDSASFDIIKVGSEQDHEAHEPTAEKTKENEYGN